MHTDRSFFNSSGPYEGDPLYFSNAQYLTTDSGFEVIEPI